MSEDNKDITILAIESSCDDTSAAVIRNTEILSNAIARQDVHESYGGVVPELASRAHQQNIVPVVHEAMKRASVEPSELDAVAFTKGPGLLGSLLVGVSFGKALAQSLDIPIIEVNHMQAHVLAHFIDGQGDKPEFPFLCLTVSGGHTQLVLVEDYLNMRVVGETRDDAAGETFDKAAKMLGLPYPGGPLVDKLAKEGDMRKFEFPISDMDDLNYSFSGLKTSILYFLQKEMKKDPGFIESNLNDLCASIQHTIITALMKKVALAIEKYSVKHFCVAGGVSANSFLRATITEFGKKYGVKTHIPEFQYCTDNAGMIAITAYYKYKRGMFATLDIAATARLNLSIS